MTQGKHFDNIVILCAQEEQEVTAAEIAGLKADKTGLEVKISTLQQEVQSG